MLDPNSPKRVCLAIHNYAINLNQTGPRWLLDELRHRALKMSNTQGSINLQKKRALIFVAAAIKSAELVLPIFEAKFSDHHWPRKTIKAAHDALGAGCASDDANLAAIDASDFTYGCANFVSREGAAAATIAYAAYAAGRATDGPAAAQYASLAPCSASRAVHADDADAHWRIALEALDEAIAVTEMAS